MPALEIIDPGLHTTVQDLGRIGFRDVGVPASGPLDRVSFRLANALVGNPHGAPALEMLLVGPTLKVIACSARVALAGCGANIDIGLDGSRCIPSGRSVTLFRNDVFRVAALVDSVSAYLAIEGGLDIVPVLGSASTYVRGRIGGFEGRRLQPRDVLPLKLDQAETRDEYALARPLDLAFEQTIRVVLGPQADYFTGDTIRSFLSSDYKISRQSDRMGYRLEGPRLVHAKGYDIASDGIVTGAIQVPGSGLPIVLMVDNPTTGGYPKIATVISADLPALGRRRPGQTVRFAAVGVSEAQQLLRQQETTIQQISNTLRHV